MSIPKTPITVREERYDCGYLESIHDADGNFIDYPIIARDLTEFYEMKRRQEECGKTGHKVCQWEQFGECGSQRLTNNTCCPLCGADLTKGATHES